MDRRYLGRDSRKIVRLAKSTGGATARARLFTWRWVLASFCTWFWLGSLFNLIFRIIICCSCWLYIILDLWVSCVWVYVVVCVPFQLMFRSSCHNLAWREAWETWKVFHPVRRRGLCCVSLWYFGQIALNDIHFFLEHSTIPYRLDTTKFSFSSEQIVVLHSLYLLAGTWYLIFSKKSLGNLI